MTDKKMMDQVTQAADLKLKADLVTLAAARDKAISTAITSANSKFQGYRRAQESRGRGDCYCDSQQDEAGVGQNHGRVFDRGCGPL